MRDQPIKTARFEEFNAALNQESVEQLFNYYEQTGFLYPEKKQLLIPHWNTIVDNWNTLLKSKEELLWIMSTKTNDTNDYASISTWKQSNTGLQAQHLVSTGNPFLSLKVMLAAQFRAQHVLSLSLIHI